MLGGLRARFGGAAAVSSIRSGILASRAPACSQERMSSQTPPPDAARGATADLCDTFIKDPVDIVNERNVQIMDPIFRNFGGHSRFKGQAATVKCFENNPLVRKASSQLGLFVTPRTPSAPKGLHEHRSKSQLMF